MTGAPEARALQLPESGVVDKLVLSRGNLFLVTTRSGDVAPAGARDLGLFHEDTRHLSHLELRCSGGPMTLLSGDASSSALAQMDLTLTDREFGGLVEEPQNVLHIRRKHLLEEDELVVQVLVTNHLRERARLWIELLVGADFADMFEVRGARRVRRGDLLPAEIGPAEIGLGYRGLDGLIYRTVLRFAPDPSELTAATARYVLMLDPGETAVSECTVSLARAEPPRARRARPFDVRLGATHEDARDFAESCTRFAANDQTLQGILDRSLQDIYALRIRHDARWIVSAGIPWFAAPFGRDSIVASLQTLPLTPTLARETLRTLAAYQGRLDDPEREEEPGKIMHELRRGELARTGEIPQSPYYGSVDATPLFVVLVGELHRWMADDAFLAEIAPATERALAWIDRQTSDGTDLLRYERRSRRGLVNQGWKDSRDAVAFPDGVLARPPIALVEVQGYVADAYAAAAALSARHGDRTRALSFEAKAARMRALIEDRFWMPDEGYFALALDGEGRRVPTISSNPGHLLFSRAVTPPRALRIAEVLLSPMLFSGYGIRTVGRGQAIYNPLSYHNGSVWPHDNAMSGIGMAWFGLVAGTLSILDGLRGVAAHFPQQRLPELFCGTARGEGDVLVKYPVSCSPQAWAAGAVYMLLQGILGLDPHAGERRLCVRNPHLPEWLDQLDLERMEVGKAQVSLRFLRVDRRCHVDVLDLSGGPLKVQIELD